MFLSRPMIFTLPVMTSVTHHREAVYGNGPFSAPQTAKSAAVISWPTRNVLYARWSSKESSAAVISGKAVTVGNDFARAKYAALCGR